MAIQWPETDLLDTQSRYYLEAALLIHLAEATLVDELTHSLERRIAIGHIGLHSLQHLKNGLVYLSSGWSALPIENPGNPGKNAIRV